ncbi:hypothetical protein ACFCZ3_20225 [Cellulosimicrobium cellulans]|uniref:hypothetical protein n=1 Tax=Cellulosimicrobium cellulans TaxID=1710 RepID=UPI0035DBB455
MTSIPRGAVVQVTTDPGARAAAPLAGQRAVVVAADGAALFVEAEDGSARALVPASDVEPVTDGCAVVVELSPGAATADALDAARRRARDAYAALHGDPLGVFPPHAGRGEYRATTPDGARYAAVRIY